MLAFLMGFTLHFSLSPWYYKWIIIYIVLAVLEQKPQDFCPCNKLSK